MVMVALELCKSRKRVAIACHCWVGMVSQLTLTENSGKEISYNIIIGSAWLATVSNTKREIYFGTQAWSIVGIRAVKFGKLAPIAVGTFRLVMHCQLTYPANDCTQLTTQGGMSWATTFEMLMVLSTTSHKIRSMFA